MVARAVSNCLMVASMFVLPSGASKMPLKVEE
jgi:hypothetical protein